MLKKPIWKKQKMKMGNEDDHDEIEDEDNHASNGVDGEENGEEKSGDEEMQNAD